MAKPLNLKVDRSAKTTLAEQIRYGIATAIDLPGILGIAASKFFVTGRIPGRSWKSISR